MSGIWTNPRALESQHAERAAIEARKRAKRLADARESARVASRIRAAYEELLSRPSDYRPLSDYVPAYPWQKS